MPRPDQVAANVGNVATSELNLIPKGFGEATYQPDSLQSAAGILGMSATYVGEVAQQYGVSLGNDALMYLLPNWESRIMEVDTLSIIHEEGRQQDFPGMVTDVVTSNGTGLGTVTLKVVMSYFKSGRQAIKTNQRGFWVENLTITDQNFNEYRLTQDGTDNGDGTYNITITPLGGAFNLKVVDGDFPPIPKGTLFGVRGIGYDPSNPTINNSTFRPSEKFLNYMTMETQACRIAGAQNDVRPNIVRAELDKEFTGSDPISLIAFKSESQKRALMTLNQKIQHHARWGVANTDPNNGIYRGWGLHHQCDDELKFTHPRGGFTIKHLERILNNMKDRIGTPVNEDEMYVCLLPRDEYSSFMKNYIYEKYESIEINQDLYISESMAKRGITLPRRQLEKAYFIEGLVVAFREDVAASDAAAHAGFQQNTPYRNNGPASHLVTVLYTGRKPQTSITGKPGAQGGDYCITPYRHSRYGALHSAYREGMSTPTGELKSGLVDSFIQVAEEFMITSLALKLEFSGAMAESQGI